MIEMMKSVPNDNQDIAIEKGTWQLPNPTLLLFAKFLDQAFVSQFVEECKDSYEIFASGRDMLFYSDEIELFAKLFFYLCSITSNTASPGQLFCEIKQFSVVSERENEVQVPSIYQKIFISATYALVPYIYQKKSRIWKLIADTWNIIFQPEVIDVPFSEITSEEVHEVPAEDKYSSFLSMTVRALINSLRSISNDVDKCLERIGSYAYDIHLAIFLFSGMYLEIPLRLTKTLLLTNRDSYFQMKLKSLSWLLSFRLLILGYYGMRVYLSELDEQQVASTSVGVSNEHEASEDSSLDATGEVSTSSGNKAQLQCPLCLDQVHQPAVIPCGHTGCWNCIMSYAMKVPTNASSNTSHTNTNMRSNYIVKCPVCRHEFVIQKVRPLYL